MAMMRRKTTQFYEAFIKWNNKTWSQYCNGWYECEMGNDNIGAKDVMKNGLANKKITGERLIHVGFSANNNLTVGGTLFQRKKIQTLPWTSPNGRVKQHIDHILINKKWRASLQEVGAWRGPDIKLVLPCQGKIKLKLRYSKIKSERHDFGVNKLTYRNIRRNFCLELKNRLAAIGNIETPWRALEYKYLQILEKRYLV